MNDSILLVECLEEFKVSNELDMTNNDLFEIFSMLLITQNSETSFDEISECVVDGGLDGGIDSFVILINDKSVTSIDHLDEIKFTEKTEVQILIAQSKFEKSFKEDPVNRLQSSIPLILNLDLDEDDLLVRFNSKLVEKIDLFRRIWRKSIVKNSKISIRYIYCCKADEISINAAFQSKIDQLIELTKELTRVQDIQFLPYSAKELLTLYSKDLPTQLELIFKENPIPIAFSETEYGYIGVATLNNYFDFITDDNENVREHIFENNIRHYQGEVDVNNKIATTLSEDKEKDFWWLNNGITIICSKCQPMLKSLFLENPQIVNGLQTSYSIGKYFTKDSNDNRCVLIKIVKTEIKKTIDTIISASNSQNPVPPVLLRATDEIQRNIESYCLEQGYFYDRRKNFYKNQGKPANKIISIQNMAQAIEAILNFSPANARSKPTTLIKSDTTYNKIFNPSVNFEAYLKSALIHKELTKLINNNENIEKDLAKNFAYHLSRILVSFVLNKSNYNSEDVVGFDLSSINQAKLNESYSLLKSILDEYQSQNPTENIINISKSNRFVSVINKKISEVFPN
ncbi:AIPR family protein [Bacillus sp. T33-2]|uniref:AIPR family protein n=1 Tax=Bacillus sp. T33-2 TaxID=2054168 RepID=UPI000C787A88|nr:AIPR family protein [Bacillus sp. T33-2]PLR94848.1 abortive phage infection protein [Bacillus sp. T33-2]